MIVFGPRKIDLLVEMRQRPQGMKVRRDGTPEVTAARRLGQTPREANGRTLEERAEGMKE